MLCIQLKEACYAINNTVIIILIVQEQLLGNKYL